MRHGQRVSMILLGLALFIGSLIWLSQRKPPAPARPDQGPQPLIPWPRQVVSLRLENEKGQFRFVRGKDENEWQLVEPAPTQMDPIYASIMCGHFLGLKKERIVGQGDQDLEKFGLHQPPGRVTYFFRGDQPELLLELGKITPIQKNLYARVVGRPEIFLVDRIVYQYLDRDLDSFRLRKLTLTQPQELTSVDIQYLDSRAQPWFPLGGSSRFISQVSPTGTKWIMLEPFQETVDTNTIYKFVQSLGNLAVRSQEIPSDAGSRFGLDRPVLGVALEHKDHNLERLLFSRPQPEKPVFYARNSSWNLVFEIPLANMAATFNQDFRRVFLLDPDSQDLMTKIAVTFPSHPEWNYTLVQATLATWILEDEPNRPLHPFALSWVISPLSEVPLQSYYVYDRKESSARFGLESPRAVIQLYNGAVPIGKLVIGAATSKPNGCYVLDRQRDARFWVSNDLYEKIPHQRKVFYLQETEKAAP